MQSCRLFKLALILLFIISDVGQEGRTSERYRAQMCIRSHLDPFSILRRQLAFMNAWNLKKKKKIDGQMDSLARSIDLCLEL